MRRNAAGVLGALLLTFRGVLLWIIIPVGTLSWLLGIQWVGKNGVSLGALLGWLDLNTTFVLARGLLRPLFPDATAKWIPASERSRVTHRIGMGDLF